MKHVRSRQLLAFGLVLGVGLMVACGETKSTPRSAGSSQSTGSGGSSTSGGGGEAGSDTGPQGMMCGTSQCEGLGLGIPGAPQTDACCPEGGAEPCGVKTDFLADFGVELSRSCQPLHSPGELDDSCPVSPPILVANTVSLTFPGCCLPAGKCGFMLDSVANAIPLGLGCLDATELPSPMLSDPPACGPGVGVGGEGGSGGAN